MQCKKFNHTYKLHSIHLGIFQLCYVSDETLHFLDTISLKRLCNEIPGVQNHTTTMSNPMKFSLHKVFILCSMWGTHIALCIQ